MSDWNWDVRTTVNNGNAPQFQAAFDQINGMCYLLAEMTYNDLYNGTILDVVNNLAVRMLVAPDTLFSSTEKSECDRIRNEIIQELQSGSLTHLQMRNLYQLEDNPAIPQVIYDLFLEMRTVVPKLCYPFIELRDNGNLISASKINQLVNAFGSYTQFQLYTAPRNTATSEAKDAILEAYAVSLMTTKDNDRIWDNNTSDCVSQLAQYCSTNSTGDPTLACTGLSL